MAGPKENAVHRRDSKLNTTEECGTLMVPNSTQLRKVSRRAPFEEPELVLFGRNMNQVAMQYLLEILYRDGGGGGGGVVVVKCRARI